MFELMFPLQSDSDVCPVATLSAHGCTPSFPTAFACHWMFQLNCPFVGM